MQAVNSMFMCFYGFAMTLVCWVIWAYKVIRPEFHQFNNDAFWHLTYDDLKADLCLSLQQEAFGVYMLPFVGRPGPIVSTLRTSLIWDTPLDLMRITNGCSTRMLTWEQLTTEMMIEQSDLPSAGLVQNFPM